MLQQGAQPDRSGRPENKRKLFNALSVDIEDWFQVGAFEPVINRADWDSLECRVERNTDAVLQLFADGGVHATFFTLGWVAERYPALIQRIVAAGHEVASHGYDHKRVFNLTADEFAADLIKTRKILEDASGQPVTGYRAPSFSIDQRTPWAHRIIAEQGYTYSSSVAPIHHDHYGWHGSPRFAWKPVDGSALVELPVTTAQYGSRTLAAGGGGFFRVLPYWLYAHAVNKVHHQDGHGAIFYFHPWEIDPDQPRVANASLRSKLRHYTKLSVMADKMRRLMTDYRWGRMDELASLEREFAA
ncbi:MAG: XrtA system polysaccharide deacetylase [Parasphingorhabdus sp.]|nr:XrtA system polysaccharide deacetylase [Parasphingorhabdus sp.]